MDEVLGDRQVSGQQLRDTLALMLFRNDDAFKRIGMLSGGERARVRLAQLLLDKPNVLVLDEPTNHLDIASREALEGALAGFEGTILCVSHDRYFIDKVIRRMLIVQPPDILSFEGNYSAWQAKQKADAEAQALKAEARQIANRKSQIAIPPPAPASDKKRKDNPY